MIGSKSVDTFDDTQRLRAGSAVSWGAILAGAVVAVATSVILVELGAGLGFAAISPWADRGASASTFAISSAIWLIVTQWLSAVLGGYIAGRLRHRWLATHQHEVFFRDTAHGLAAWSVATLVVVLVAGVSLSALGGGAARAGGAAAGMGMHGAMEGGANSAMGAPGPGEETMFGVDKLFRSSTPGMTMPGAMAPGAAPTGATAPGGSSGMGGQSDGHMEVMHIAASAASTGDISAEDRTYLTSLVAAKTGVSSDEAQKRVDAFATQLKDIETRAKSAADAARKAAAQTAIYMSLAMLIGAFIASISAALGGRLRDEHL